MKAAAVIALDDIPDDDIICELCDVHLEGFEADPAFATVDIVHEAPSFLDVGERDQFNAHLRDGARCLLVIYMQEGVPEES